MSWEQLLGIRDQQRDDAEFNRQRRAEPPACPEHGWPLDEGPGGQYHCTFGGHIVHPT